jgi:dipeptidase
MRKDRLFILIFTFIYCIEGYTCTNLLVTKGASKDGSTMISYLADSHILFGELYYKPAQNYSAGTMFDIYEWDHNKKLGQIKQVKHTYSVVGNMNEYQVVIGETTFGGRPELPDTTAVLDYGNLIYVTLQRAQTSREAIRIMANLVAENGYWSEGESFSIADANDVWIMDMVGKGVGNKGAVWVARRIPDGYISAHANHSRITTFPLHDTMNCLYSKDVISFARAKGYFKGADEIFSFSDAYAPADFESLRFGEARVYSIFQRASPSTKFSTDYIMGNIHAEPLPLWIKPDSLITIKSAIALMRDHFEGTLLDMTKDIGSGPFQCPYRWRPLTWKVDGIEYFNERAISTMQTGFSFISQSRNYLPDAIGGVLWFGVDDSYSTVYFPMYCANTIVPPSYAEGNGNMYKYSPTSAFWIFNLVSNFAYLRYSMMIKDIQKVQSDLENQFMSNQKSVEKIALNLYDSKNKKSAIEYLTNYSIRQGELTSQRWKLLGEELLVKYIDGNVKPDSGKLEQPGYPEWWYKTVIQNSGDKFKVPVAK